MINKSTGYGFAGLVTAVPFLRALEAFGPPLTRGVQTTGVFLVLISLAGQVRSQVAEGVSRAEMRSAILNGFTFVEKKEKPIEPKDSPVFVSAESSVDSDAVVMDKIVVMERSLYWDLASDMKKARSRKAQSQSKFGTGVHERDFGKIRASCVTILYVPVLVGVSW